MTIATSDDDIKSCEKSLGTTLPDDLKLSGFTVFGYSI